MSDQTVRRPPERRRSGKQGDFRGLDEIAETADRMMASRHAARRLLGLTLDRAWARAVGEQVRAVTRLHGVERGVLVVDVIDPDWARELTQLAPEIHKRVSQLAPGRALRGLRFRHCPGAWRSDEPAGDSARIRGAERAEEAFAAPSLEGALEDRFGVVMRRYLRNSRAG